MSVPLSLLNTAILMECMELLVLTAGSPVFHKDNIVLIKNVLRESLKGSGARFSKLPVITGPVKLFCFPFQMGVSKCLKIIQ